MCVFSLTFGSLILYYLFRYQNLCIGWNPRLKSHIFVGEGFPLPFSLSMCAAQFMKPQVSIHDPKGSIHESQDSIHAAGNSFFISHFTFIFHFQFSFIRNPPVTASPCHPPLGKEGFFRLPCVKGAPLQTVRDCFSFILNFPLFFTKKRPKAFISLRAFLLNRHRYIFTQKPSFNVISTIERVPKTIPSFCFALRLSLKSAIPISVIPSD